MYPNNIEDQVLKFELVHFKLGKTFCRVFGIVDMHYYKSEFF